LDAVYNSRPYTESPFARERQILSDSHFEREPFTDRIEISIGKNPGNETR
jgi:hypothetical protein